MVIVERLMTFRKWLYNFLNKTRKASPSPNDVKVGIERMEHQHLF